MRESFHVMFFVLWAMGIATAFMTAFYMFRMWFMTFSGEPRSEYHAHESPKVMTVPLMILAGLAIVSGFALFIGSGSSSSWRARSRASRSRQQHESLGAIASDVLRVRSRILC